MKFNIWLEGNCTKPPIPQVDPCANASAIHVPFHIGLGHIETTGGKTSSHLRYIWRIRWESAESFRLDEFGSRMRSQIRLSESKHDWRSALDFTDLWRTWIRWPSTGMAEKSGWRKNRKSSDMELQTSSQEPGSTENCDAGIECRSRYRKCNQVRMWGHSCVIHNARPKNCSNTFLEPWLDEVNFWIKSKRRFLFSNGMQTKPQKIWICHPIQVMVGPSSHFFQLMGNLVSKHKIAIVAADNGRTCTSWNISMSST